LNVFQIDLSQTQDFLEVLSLNGLIELDDFIRLSFSVSLRWLWYFICFALNPFHNILIKLIFGCSRREMHEMLSKPVGLFALANELVHMAFHLLPF
jgi:hypothetical protein